MLWLLLSWWTVGIVSIVLGGAAFYAFLNDRTHIAFVLAGALALNLSWGYVYNSGQSDGLKKCQAQWDRAVKAERKRVDEANDRARNLQKTLDIVRAQQDREADERQAQNELEIVKKDEASDSPGACVDTDSDIERLRREFEG